MDILFFLLFILSFLAIFIFAILAVIKFIKKDRTGGLKNLGISGISFVVLVISSIGLVATHDATETAQIDEENGETALESIEEDVEEVADEQIEVKEDEAESEQSEDSSTVGSVSLSKNSKETNENEPVNNVQKSKQGPSASSLGLTVATVSRVIDGDTLELSDGRKVRLIGVNTPESTTRTETYGKEASNYSKSKLQGRQVYLQKDVSETDRYGRLLRLIWLEVQTNLMDETEIRTKMFNADLVLNGYAEPSTYPPDVTYAEYFRKFAREAREKEVGLWAYGPEGTTKGDLDSKKSSTNKNTTSNDTSSSNTNTPSNNTGSSNNSNSSASSDPSSPNYVVPGAPTNFRNCDEMRQYYPNGVPQSHPAYAPARDRDKDGWACERS